MTTRRKKVPLKTLLGEDDDDEDDDEGEVIITPVLPKLNKQGKPRPYQAPLVTPNKPIITPTKPRAVSMPNKPTVSTPKKPVAPANTKPTAKKPVKISVPTLPTPHAKEMKHLPSRHVTEESKIPPISNEVVKSTDVPEKEENSFVEKKLVEPDLPDVALPPQSPRQKQQVKESSSQVSLNNTLPLKLCVLDWARDVISPIQNKL